MVTAPRIAQTVIDTLDARRAAEFYRQLFALTYRAGDEPPPDGEPDERGRDWLVLRGPGGGTDLAFQQVDELPASTWPADEVPQQLHLDTTVPTRADLDHAYERAMALGARVLLDRTDDPDEMLWVLADLDGHPFCIFVSG